MNDALRYLYALLVKRIKGEFTKVDQTIAIASGVGTLPWDCGRVISLKNEYGRLMWPLNPTQRVPITSVGSTRLYWHQKSRQVRVENATVSANYLLTYIAKPREIHFGQSSAGDTNELTLDSSYAKKIADYYNDMEIENITDDWIDTITDYTAARVATITNNGAASKYYGLVAEIPEHFHHLIAPFGAMFTKDASPVAQEKTTTQERDNASGLLIEALRAFAGSEQEVDYEDVFTDFEPVAPISGVVVLR
jgi:hypothetical protein